MTGTGLSRRTVNRLNKLAVHESRRPLAPPSLATRRWVTSKWIAWRKATERA
jgi:hypothetical protein